MNRSNSRRHRSHRRRHRINRRPIINETVSAVTTTSKRYMPKVKHGLENVGSSVTNSVPFFQTMTRKIFEMFTTNKNTRRHKRHRK
jgi:IS5 family transposase